MFIINRCFNNIWLESQMIHVALFSFQRTTLSFEALSLQATHLLYRSFFILSRTFSFHFEDFGVHEIHERLPIKELHLISFMSAGVLRRLVLYYMTSMHLSTPAAKNLNFLPASYISQDKNKSASLCDALISQMVAAQRFELRTLRVWTACSSQLSYAAIKWWAGMDSNHRNPKMTDLQSVPFNHSGTYPCLNKCVKNSIYYIFSLCTCQHLI